MHLGLPWIKWAPEKVIVLEQYYLCFIQGEHWLGKEYSEAYAVGEELRKSK